MVKLDCLFVFYVNNNFAFTPIRYIDYEADGVFMDCEDGTRSDDNIRNRLKDQFLLTNKNLSSEGPKLYIVDSPQN